MDEDKDKYRKIKFSPVFDGPCQDPESLGYLQWCKDKLIFYPDSKNKIEQLLIDLGEKGANLKTIVSSLQKPRSADVRQTKQGPTLKADFKRHKKHLKSERAVRNAFNLLFEKLKPVLYEYEQSAEVNRKVKTFIGALRDFHPSLEDYLDLLLVQTCSRELCEETGLRFETLARLGREETTSKLRLPAKTFAKTEEINFRNTLMLCPPEKIREWIKEKRELTSRTHGVWSESICSIAQEVMRIGYADNSTFKITAHLFKLQYPKIFTDDLEYLKDQFKQRYKNPKNKR